MLATVLRPTGEKGTLNAATMVVFVFVQISEFLVQVILKKCFAKQEEMESKLVHYGCSTKVLVTLNLAKWLNIVQSFNQIAMQCNTQAHNLSTFISTSFSLSNFAKFQFRDS